jgi:DNA-binding transcriptional LysR family regulator
LAGNGITATHQVTTLDDVLALLKADVGVAIVPVGAVAAEANGVRSIPLRQLGLVRRVSVYGVAGRRRAIAGATLFNMLRAADWGFDTETKQQKRA